MIGAADAGGEFGAQGQRIAAAVREGVHLLGDDVGGLADRAGEDLGRLEHRHLDMLEGVEPAHAIERGDHRVEAVGLLADMSWVPRTFCGPLLIGGALALLARVGSRAGPNKRGWTNRGPNS